MKRPSEAGGSVGQQVRIKSIGIAGIAVVHTPAKIRTVLGSCIGVALYDREAKLGGMCHVILPDSKEGSGDPAKFADTAVDILLDRMLGEGAERQRLRAKIAGGASMFGAASNSGLGTRNAESVVARLAHHSIRLVGSVVGGGKGRRICLDPSTGEVEVSVIGEKPTIL